MVNIPIVPSLLHLSYVCLLIFQNLHLLVTSGHIGKSYLDGVQSHMWLVKSTFLNLESQLLSKLSHVRAISNPNFCRISVFDRWNWPSFVAKKNRPARRRSATASHRWALRTWPSVVQLWRGCRTWWRDLDDLWLFHWVFNEASWKLDQIYIYIYIDIDISMYYILH